MFRHCIPVTSSTKNWVKTLIVKVKYVIVFHTFGS